LDKQDLQTLSPNCEQDCLRGERRMRMDGA
jgi:hypothetical protein